MSFRLSHPTNYRALRLHRSTVRFDHLLPTSDLTCNLRTGKIVTAWTQTPTKWYPLPLAVGALLLVVMQYHKMSRAQKEVHVDEEGREVIKLKGPWQVCTRVSFIVPLIKASPGSRNGCFTAPQSFSGLGLPELVRTPHLDSSLRYSPLRFCFRM